MIPKTDMDYVEFFANQLKKDNLIFKQQKQLIESQLKISSSLFKNKFSNDNEFKANARDYLKNRGLI